MLFAHPQQWPRTGLEQGEFFFGGTRKNGEKDTKMK